MTRLSTLREGFPVTFAGGALLALAAAAFWFGGVRRLDLVLLSGAILVVLLIAGLLLATLLAALLLRRRRPPSRAPLFLEAGLWTPTGFPVPLSPWVPFLQARVGWEDPPGVQAELRSGQEWAHPARRGLCPRVLRRVRVGDILGLTEIGWRVVDPVPVRILPRHAALDPGASLAGLIQGGEEADPHGTPQGDRVDIRKYGHGDPMRMILWKVYARTRKAFVRIPERAVEPAPRICAYLPACPQDEPAAGLARTLLERGLLGAGWRFGADGAEDAQTLPGALEALARSGSEPGQGGLGPFLDRARRDGFGACILLLPAQAGPWTAALQAPLASSPLRIHAVLALGGRLAQLPPLWQRALLQPPPAGGATPGEVLDLLGQVVLPGMGSTLVDTLAGDVLDHPQAFLAKAAGRPS